MKRWKLCASGVLSGALISGCSGGGGSSSYAATASSACGTVLSEPMSNGSMSAQSTSDSDSGSSAQPQDPYDRYGKVLLDRSGSAEVRGDYDNLSPQDIPYLTDPNHAAFIQTMDDGEAKILKAGTEFTVQLSENCDASGEISSTIRSSSASALEATMTPSGVRDYTWTLPQDMSIAELGEMADQDSCVRGLADEKRAYVDAEVTEPIAANDLATPMDLPADPLVQEQGHLRVLEAEHGFDHVGFAAAGNEVVIAVIDTGIDMEHEDLKGMLWVNTDEIPGNNIDDDNNGYVDDVNGYNFADKKPSPHYSGTWSLYHHGTHVAGLAAAQAGNNVGGTGVMGSGVKIMGLNVFGRTSGARGSDVANAIRYAADNGATVINMSIGGQGLNPAYESAIAYAVQAGSVVVAAAGNERRELGTKFFLSPGGYGQQFAGMIAVGSVDSSDLSYSTFSNYSPVYVELGAPGSEESSSRNGLLSTMPKGRYSRIQGTSMASPVAAGGVALAAKMLRDRGYTPSPATLEGLMMTAASAMPELQEKIRAGRVMNLRLLAQFINQHYAGGSGDPGVPGNACAL